MNSVMEQKIKIYTSETMNSGRLLTVLHEVMIGGLLLVVVLDGGMLDG